MTRFAADYGGLLSLNRRLQCGTSSEDDVDDNLACWDDDGGWVRRWRNEMLSFGGRGSFVMMVFLETGNIVPDLDNDYDLITGATETGVVRPRVRRGNE